MFLSNQSSMMDFLHALHWGCYWCSSKLMCLENRSDFLRGWRASRLKLFSDQTTKVAFNIKLLPCNQSSNHRGPVTYIFFVFDSDEINQTLQVNKFWKRWFIYYFVLLILSFSDFRLLSQIFMVSFKSTPCITKAVAQKKTLWRIHKRY